MDARDRNEAHNLFEFQEIWKDVKKAPGLKNKFMYIFAPPVGATTAAA
ncbi:MAG: hypothetical protein M9900_03085 [Flavobacteriales bacterium]|nr:hypothetical protein [Flavobacteriales bacterium]